MMGRLGLERNDFYITYEPVGNMFRNSRGITPRNNFLIDSFWSLVGTVSPSSFVSLSLSFSVLIKHGTVDCVTDLGLDVGGWGG